MLMIPLLNYSGIISFILLTGILIPGFSNYYDPEKAEDSLMILFMELGSATSPDKQKQLNTSIIDILKETLKNPGSFDYPFDSVPSMGKAYSQDRSLRIYSWHYSESPVRHHYSGFLQLRDKESNRIDLFFLNHKETNDKNIENRSFSHKNWYGALYYQVHKIHYDNRKFYTLIGFDFNNYFTNVKIIDVLTFIENKPVFGYPIFRFGDDLKHRIVFEYSAGVVMFLRYVPDLDMIVYDHLSPSLPRFRGQYRYYGPDLSYDALRFKNGFWVHVSDIQFNK